MLRAIVLGLLAGLGSLPLVAADTYCDVDTPCATGCCGINNVCGTGPDYCSSAKCITNCDYKAECNPGDWDATYYNSSTCPLNVCCSKYGFCGTTEEFCGTEDTVTRPSCDVDSQSITRVIGYYASGGASRACNAMIPQSIPQGVYSHLYFAFGSIDPDTFKVIPATDHDETLYPQLKALKSRDLGQELWISIGGWDFSDSDEPTATTFSDLVNAEITHQNVFFASLLLYMTTWGFTGVDIDWEYPGADDRNGRAEDYDNYPVFLSRLKDALDDYNYGLSITLPTSYWYLQNFDLVSIEPSVDWFNFMSYDLHGTWDIGDEWTGAYLDAHTNLTEIETALDLLWRNNITSTKVNLGYAFYGRSFTLASSSCSEPGCAYLSAGDAGKCSDSAGILLNSEIKSIINEKDLTPTFYKDAAVKTITWNGDQWVSYDDQETLKIKSDFAKSQCLGGVLVWSVDYDDYNNTYSDGLAAALGNELNVDTETGLTISIAETTTDTTQGTQSQYCYWTNCGETCPSGYTSIVRDDKKSQLMLDSTQCIYQESLTQTLCCPTSTDVPTCRWRGFRNSGSCNGGCNAGEAEVGTTAAGCNTGFQSACCTITTSTTPWSECKWGSSCESDETCPSDYPIFAASSKNGFGGRWTCRDSNHHNYCCKGTTLPDAFTNCEWKGHEVAFSSDSFCSDSCPSGTIRIAEEYIGPIMFSTAKAQTAGCSYGNEGYCCSGATNSTVTPRSSGDKVFTYADQTAQEFDLYLTKYLASPVCPAEWDAQYDAGLTLSARGLEMENSARELLSVRATDESVTLTYLMPMVLTWITSQYPREDLTTIWNTRLSEAGYGTTGANSSVLTEVLYEGTWSGNPVYSPETLVANTLCDITDSADALENMDTASLALCLDDGETLTLPNKRDVMNPSRDDALTAITSRELTPTTMSARNRNGVLPSIAAVLRGILKGDLSLHYLRWINAEGSQVILEAAFWIGSQVGVAPTNTPNSRETYGDSSHYNSGTPDRWVIMHFHIPIDRYTFRGNAPAWYPGANTVTMYHSQSIVRPAAVTYGRTADLRAEFRYSRNYAGGGSNTGTMAGYNNRAQAISCRLDVQTEYDRRWSIGFDHQTNINTITTLNNNAGVTRRPTELATLLNRFGIWLRARGANGDTFSLSNMQVLFPNLSNTLNNGRSQIRGNHDYTAEYDPQPGAFDTNWMPNRANSPPDLSNADP